MSLSCCHSCRNATRQMCGRRSPRSFRCVPWATRLEPSLINGSSRPWCVFTELVRGLPIQALTVEAGKGDFDPLARCPWRQAARWATGVPLALGVCPQQPQTHRVTGRRVLWPGHLRTDLLARPRRHRRRSRALAWS
jgi:hypothetical protein